MKHYYTIANESFDGTDFFNNSLLFFSPAHPFFSTVSVLSSWRSVKMNKLFRPADLGFVGFYEISYLSSFSWFFMFFFLVVRWLAFPFLEFHFYTKAKGFFLGKLNFINTPNHDIS